LVLGQQPLIQPLRRLQITNPPQISAGTTVKNPAFSAHKKMIKRPGELGDLVAVGRAPRNAGVLPVETMA